LLQPLEEALDEIALAVEGKVRLPWFLAVGFRRNDGGDVTRLERLDKGVGVVALVGDESLRLDLAQQRLGLGDVGRLPRRQGENDRIAECVDDGMDLGRQSASRAADGLSLAVFFWAPALC
jgi:hypothetical protein